jgi:hypothetical protein
LLRKSLGFVDEPRKIYDEVVDCNPLSAKPDDPDKAFLRCAAARSKVDFVLHGKEKIEITCFRREYLLLILYQVIPN